MCAATVPRMLDAIAGYTIKRIRARHVTAISRPADIATMLHAYADLQHTSVVSTEHRHTRDTSHRHIAQSSSVSVPDFAAAAYIRVVSMEHRHSSVGPHVAWSDGLHAQSVSKAERN